MERHSIEPGRTLNSIVAVAFLLLISAVASGEEQKPALTTRPSLEPPKGTVLEKPAPDAKIPAYQLPLAKTQLKNLTRLARKVSMTDGELGLLAKNGFVVTDDLVPKVVFEDYVQFYEKLGELKLPIFITSDSILHYFHLFFDTALMRLEEGYFYDDLLAIDRTMLEAAVKDHAASDGELKEAARRNIAYFSVALELLKPGKRGKASVIPEIARKEVLGELALLKKHQGFAPSPLLVYQEDYSQYVPRGHYNKSEKLRRYFMAMMWHGRMTLLAKGSPALAKGASECRPDGIISEADARTQNLQALLIVKHYQEKPALQEKWKRIYAITSFFVGPSDDLGFPEYLRLLKVSEPSRFPAVSKESAKKLTDALLALKVEPRIYSGLGNCQLSPPFDSASAQKLLHRTKGFRFMGQRFTVDSWLMSEIVSPYSGEYTGKRTPAPFTLVQTAAGRQVRGFPRGLDVMALLGSKRARKLLDETGDASYSKFPSRFSELEKRVRGFEQHQWFQDLTMSWLHVLQTLLGEYGAGYPSFMRTTAWQDRQLVAALASWTELRHDTLLYVKQSATVAECEGGDDPDQGITGFVEPVPLFYQRLATLLSIMQTGFAKHLTKTELKRIDVQFGLEEFSRMVSKLQTITRKELANQRLSRQEYDFIKDFGVTSETLISTVMKGSNPRSYAYDVNADSLKTTLVADVHTDGNTRQVLEEGVGYLRTLIVAYPTPSGKILLATGPVFSQYEWKQPMAERLTDQAWREKLKSQPPEEPSWTRSFREIRPRKNVKKKALPKLFPSKGC